VNISRKTCPVCGQSVITLITEFANGKIVRRFCHHCMGDKDAVVIEESPDGMTGGLADYPIEERLTDLSGKDFAKVKHDKPN